jgi:electron transfer flavoprotein alpha/beta subunit
LGTNTSTDGQRMLRLISRGVDTADALEDADPRHDPEATARTLAALTARGLITRKYERGEMRYRAT